MKKRMACLALALALLMGCMPAALAADAGMAAPETVSLEDFKLNVPVEIANYGTLTGVSCEFEDTLQYYPANSPITKPFLSGVEAQYLLLKLDILNNTLSKMNYLKACSVTVYYNEDYQFSGFGYQYDYDRNDSNAVLEKEEFFDISPLYVGHYVFGCMVPNAVEELEGPLKIVIELDGNIITYNVRK